MKAKPSHHSPMAGFLLTLLVFLNFHSSLLLTTSSYQVSLGPNLTYPLSCSNRTQTCSSLLYHQFNGLTRQQLSSYYNVDPSRDITTPYGNGHQQDSLVSVSCSCNEINGSLGRTVGFIYGTVYDVQPSDTFGEVSNKKYSGQALEVGGENTTFAPGKNVFVPLLCGCVDSSSQIIVTYTAQPHDTLSDVANRLSARVDGILKLNKILNNSDFVDVGWVLFVPMEKNGIPLPKSGKPRKWERWSIVAGVLSTVTLVTLCALGGILFRRKKRAIYSSHESMAKTHQQYKLKTEDFAIFEPERPVTYEVEEIAEATKNFDESRIIGEGGYGRVYVGMIGQKEVAIKKMKSNLCKQFYAELKVLCRIHHINVVELLGYASGNDHLYLVYEYVRNGSLSDHLHNPFTKGFDKAALCWTARTQIALDSAKGIEYIHDHTKARYVHRDIKTSNILLDQGLRAKVADFGLAKLVERRGHGDDDLIVTQLVGTPGYLPPESIKELQVTTKTDVFAFGVVLAELVTGRRALVRDMEEPQKMKSLITVVDKMFEDEDPLKALVGIIDENLQGNYPVENVYKMVEMAAWCLSGEPVDRPDMREVVVVLSQIVTASLQWELATASSSSFVGGSSTTTHDQVLLSMGRR